MTDDAALVTMFVAAVDAEYAVTHGGSGLRRAITTIDNTARAICMAHGWDASRCVWLEPCDLATIRQLLAALASDLRRNRVASARDTLCEIRGACEAILARHEAAR